MRKTHFDDLTLAKFEFELFAAIAGRVEFGAIGQRTGVVHLNGGALWWVVGSVTGLKNRFSCGVTF